MRQQPRVGARHRRCRVAAAAAAVATLALLPHEALASRAQGLDAELRADVQQLPPRTARATGSAGSSCHRALALARVRGRAGQGHARCARWLLPVARAEAHLHSKFTGQAQVATAMQTRRRAYT